MVFCWKKRGFMGVIQISLGGSFDGSFGGSLGSGSFNCGYFWLEVFKLSVLDVEVVGWRFYKVKIDLQIGFVVKRVSN